MSLISFTSPSAAYTSISRNSALPSVSDGRGAINSTTPDETEASRVATPESIAITQRWLNKMDSDPQFADEMAYNLSHIDDKELVSINDLPPLYDERAWQGYRNHVSEFEHLAKGVTAQRTELYEAMKANSVSGKEIYKAILDFNRRLPMDYQLATGVVRYSTYA